MKGIVLAERSVTQLYPVTQIDEEVGSQTSSIQVTNATRTIVDRAQSEYHEATEQFAGLYHMSCSGKVSWCGFAQAIISRLGDSSAGDLPVINPIASDDYPTAAIRPRNSLLSNTKLQGRFKVSLPPWEVALDEVMRKV
jgi:dTDP-4-dehydrorhamnose reductase